MVNKSYRIGYNFQRRVVKHLKEQGYNCIVQPKSAFPDIIAWRPFLDANGMSPVIFTQVNNGDEIIHKQFVPFFVTLIECKVNKYLSKKEKEAAEIILKEGRCNVFLTAYREGRKLKFQEFGFKEKKIKKTKFKKNIPSYLG